MPKQQILQERNWYVIHTYSGYEDAVTRNLKQRIESLGMQDKIFSVIVPKEKKIKIKNGKRQVVEEKIYPGYVLVEMIVTDDSWYVVRNTPNVTGFVGAGTTPIPVGIAEITALKSRMGVETPHYQMEAEVGDMKVVEAFADQGPTLKRNQPRARGRAYPILKRSSHITITLSDV